VKKLEFSVAQLKKHNLVYQQNLEPPKKALCKTASVQTEQVANVKLIPRKVISLKSARKCYSPQVSIGKPLATTKVAHTDSRREIRPMSSRQSRATRIQNAAINSSKKAFEALNQTESSRLSVTSPMSHRLGGLVKEGELEFDILKQEALFQEESMREMNETQTTMKSSVRKAP